VFPALAVGGVAEVPDTLESSGSSSRTLAAIATAIGLFAVVLATGGWYARRRWLR